MGGMMNSIRIERRKWFWETDLQSENSTTDDFLPGEAAEWTMLHSLTSFPSFASRSEIVASSGGSRKIPKSAAMLIAAGELDTNLRSGGGKENSRNVSMQSILRAKMPEQMVDFLKKEYGQTGKGFEINGKQIAVWFDEQGMRVGLWNTALETSDVTMSWEEVENPYTFTDGKWHLYECK